MSASPVRSFIAATPLAALLVMLPLSSVYANRGSQTVLVLSLSLAVALAVREALAGGRPILPRLAEGPVRPWLVVFLGLFAFGGATTLWAVDAGESMERAAKLFASVALGFLLFQLLPPLANRRLGNVSCMAVSVAAGLVFLELATPGMLRQVVYGPVPSAMNRSAVTLALFVWIALALAAGPRATALRLVTLVTVAAACLVSNSESSLLALTVGGAAFLLARISIRLTLTLLAIATVASIALMPLAVKWAHETVPDWMVDAGAAASVDARLATWNHIADKVAERPLTGWGFEAARGVVVPVPNVMERYRVEEFAIIHPHNGAMQVWFEVGAIGAALFAVALVLLIRDIRRLTPERQAFACAAYAATFSVGVVSHGVWQTWWINLIVAMILAFTLRGPDDGRSRADQAAI